MPENDPTVEPPLDSQDWRIAFEPYEGNSQSALTLAFHLTELKHLMDGLRMHEALAAIDRAVDQLYEHSEFRSVGHELFRVAVEGGLKTDKEELLRQLGIRI